MSIRKNSFKDEDQLFSSSTMSLSMTPFESPAFYSPFSSMAIEEQKDDILYIVKKHEHLWGIVRELFRYMNEAHDDHAINLKVEEIKKANGLNEKGDIQPGQILKIPVSPEEAILRRKSLDLPEATREIEEIERIFGKRKKKVRAIYGKNISREELLENPYKNKKYGHISTHGLSGDDGKAPRIMTKKSFENRMEVPEGVITAEEFKQLDLRGLKLMLFAACETALDHSDQAQTDEGYLNFAMAAIEAGAGNSIAQLWKISDKAARIFSVIFYTNLWENPSEDISVILRRTQLQMKGYKDNENDFGSPYFWASQKLLSDEYRKDKYGLSDKNKDQKKDLKKMLKLNEAIVEMKQIDECTYECHVMSKSSGEELKTITLTTTNVDKANGRYMSAYFKALHNVRHMTNKEASETMSQYNIYEMLWEPVQQYLDALKIDKIYFIPDGDYKEASMNMIYNTNRQKFLIEYMEIINVF